MTEHQEPGGREDGGSGYDFPTYPIDGRPSFAPLSIPGKPRVLVVSIPKSGTYLIAAFLRELGLVDTGVHINDDGFYDYRGRTISEMVSEYRQFRKILPLPKTMELVRAGQFAVGHLVWAPEALAATAGSSIIFAKRELRSAMVSMMRFLSRPGRGGDWAWKTIEEPRVRFLEFLHDRGPELLSWIESMAGWEAQPEVFTVRFEDLVQGSREHAQALAAKAGIELPPDRAAGMLERVLGQPTKTWSGGISQTAACWSDAAESLFRKLGGIELNRRLGYRDRIGTVGSKRSAESMLWEYRRMLEETKCRLAAREQEIEAVTAEKERLERTLAGYSVYSFPNLCRAAARAIEHCRRRGYRCVAFYGAGDHTAKLLPIWEGLGGPPVAALLVSENPGKPFCGRPVLAAGGPLPPEVQAVVPSSHTHETTLRKSWLPAHPEVPWVPLWEADEAAPTIPDNHD